MLVMRGQVASGQTIVVWLCEAAVEALRRIILVWAERHSRTETVAVYDKTKSKSKEGQISAWPYETSTESLSL